MRRDIGVVGFICIFAYFALIVPAGFATQVSAHGQTAGAGAVNQPKADGHLNQHQPSPPKQLTEEDYVKPRQAWLNAHGSPLDARAIYEIAEKRYGLDSDFVIATSFAETDGGRASQRGSGAANPNYWSLCSRDETQSTCSFPTQAAAIDFFGRTLTNSLLGRYTKVSQLSRCRNFTGAVYATSTENWDHNVINIMNQLKGRNETDYEFRR